MFRLFKRKPTPSKEQEMIHDYQSGTSYQALADKYGVSVQIITNVIEKGENLPHDTANQEED
jgi:Mor family transcriptional regulator